MNTVFKYALISSALILNCAFVIADTTDADKIPEINNIDLERLATNAANQDKRLMVIYYNKQCDVCDALIRNNTLNSVKQHYQLYAVDAETGFDVVCPNGDDLSDNDFFEEKGITALPAVVITDQYGNVDFVENAISSSQHLIEVGDRYKFSQTSKVVTQTSVNEIAWKKLPKGREISPIFGKMKEGHHVTFIKFAPGLKTKPHIHTHDYVGIVIKGTMRHFEQDKSNTKKLLLPGSIWSVPGKIVHVSECISKNECIFVIHQVDSFDRKVIH